MPEHGPEAGPVYRDADPSERRASDAAQRAVPRLRAWDRVDLLLDEGTFDPDAGVRSGARPPPGGTPGIVTGLGTIEGVQVFVYALDPDVASGAITPAVAARMCGAIEAALEFGVPLIALYDTEGLSLADPWEALRGTAEVFSRSASASGVVPQIALVAGPCVGLAAQVAAMSDFVFMVRGAGALYVAGPVVVEAALGDESTAEELGGAQVHASRTGLCDRAFGNEVEALLAIRDLIGYLPASNRAVAPIRPSTDSADRVDPALDTLVPREATRVYDMREVVERIGDDCEFLELQADHGPSAIVGFARFAGRTVGVVANQPLVEAGCLDVAAARKATRFARFCDAFGIPILLLLDMPGWLPGPAQEHAAIAREATRLWFALNQSTVARLNVVVRHAEGYASALLWPRLQRGDANFAWSGTELGLVGARGAVRLEGVAEGERAARERDYRASVTAPEVAVRQRFVDAVIAPRDTRRSLCHALIGLRGRDRPQPWRKHDTLF
jgi:propionyl-CoA carboxylase beta chain